MRYEYKHACLSSSQHNDMGLDWYLNKYALEGWRVIQSIPPKGVGTFVWEFLLERSVKEDGDEQGRADHVTGRACGGTV